MLVIKKQKINSFRNNSERSNKDPDKDEKIIFLEDK